MVRMPSTGAALIMAITVAAAIGIGMFLSAAAGSLSPPPDAHSTASQVQSPQAKDDWTVERMRGAQPAPMPQPDADGSSTSAEPPGQSATTSGPTVPREGPSQ
jgi:hypothetical protein